MVENIDSKAIENNVHEGMDSLHQMLLYMLTELERVSHITGLRYFLTYGTLIGAVRERSLIGWDVDADVFVPVDDYDALCTALSSLLPSDLCVYSPLSVPNYEYTFARIGYRGIDHKIVRVDLIPLGSGPRRQTARIAYSLYVRFVNLFYMLKLVPLEEKIHYGFRKKLITRFAKAVLALIPSPLLLSGVTWIRRKRFAGRTLADSCGWFGPRRQFFDADWFANTTRVELGDQLFNGPSGAHRFLEWVYGDYMNPVSAEEQEKQLRFAHRYYLTPLRQMGVIAN